MSDRCVRPCAVDLATGTMAENAVPRCPTPSGRPTQIEPPQPQHPAPFVPPDVAASVRAHASLPAQPCLPPPPTPCLAIEGGLSSGKRPEPLSPGKQGRVIQAQSAVLRAHAARDDYGRVPAYLRDLAAAAEDEERYIEDLPSAGYAAESVEKHPVRLLTAAEREQLLHGLTRRQEQLTKLVCDESCPDSKLRRYRGQLQHLGADITRLSQEYVFVGF